MKEDITEALGWQRDVFRVTKLPFKNYFPYMITTKVEQGLVRKLTVIDGH